MKAGSKTSKRYRMQQSILSEIFEEQSVAGTSCNSKKAHTCNCEQCKQQRPEGEAPRLQSNGQSLIAKGVDKIKEYIDKGIISLKIISDFSSGIIYDERQIVNRIFSLRHPAGAKNAQKLKEEIRDKIARPHFANLHTSLADRIPPCAPDFVSDLKSKAINKTVTKGSRTFSKKNTKLSPRKTTIDAIVLHHMAFSRGNDFNKYLETGAHYIVLHNGKVGQLYDDKDYLNASDGFNRRSIAIEFAGNFPYGNFKWWGSKQFTYLTPAQALAGKCLIEHIKKNNPGIKHILVHRQSCGPGRTFDPGRDVWFAVGEWAIRNLGLSDKDSAGMSILNKCYCKLHGNWQICDGWPIPDEWRKPRI